MADQPKTDDFSEMRRLIGFALVCMSVLAFEIFSSRLLSVVVSPMTTILAIAFAMLGMGIAAIFNSLTSPLTDPDHRDERNHFLLLTLAGSLLLAIAIITLKAQLNANTFREAIAEGGEQQLVSAILYSIGTDFFVTSIAFSLPYVIFGFWIADYFRYLPTEKYNKFYGADLIGAAAGCIAVVVALDHFGYRGAISIILLGCLCGAILTREKWSRSIRYWPVLTVSIISAAIVATPLIKFFEPRPSIERLGRNYDLQNTAVEEWSVWNSNSRVAQLSITDSNGENPKRVFAHQNGEGWAYLPDIHKWEADQGRAPTSALTTIFEPKDVLVLFAGVGRDMLEINSRCQGKCNITGVEINRHMVERARRIDPDLNEFLNRDNLHLEVAEAREFIGRTDKKFDSILLSWWGAGTAHAVGTTVGLAEYLYTKEAFETLVDRLNENGVIVVYNGSKMQNLATLREVFKREPAGALRDKVVIVKKRTLSRNDLVKGDFLRLILKPSGFSAVEEETVLSQIEKFGFVPVLSPSFSDPKFTFLQRIADGEPLKSVNRDVRRAGNYEVSPITDNWPFLHNMIPVERRYNVLTWGSGSNLGGPELIFRSAASLTLMLLAINIIIGVLPFQFRNGPKKTSDNRRRMYFVICIGLGFMLVEIGLVRKFGLLLGHPSFSISVVLAALILSTGLGAILSSRPAMRSFSDRAIALAIAVYAALILIASDYLVGSIIGLPIMVKSIIVIALLFPLGVLMGQLFPRVLENAGRAASRLTPWIWGVNAAASTAGSAAAYTAGFIIGVNELILLGVACYLFMPPLPSTAADETEGHSRRRWFSRWTEPRADLAGTPS